MAPLMSRPSVGRKPVGHVQQPQQPMPVSQAVVGQQQVPQQPVWQQQSQPGQVYQQQPMQRPIYQQGQQQQPMQQPVYQQQSIQQSGLQQGQQQQPIFQQPFQQQVSQQPVYQHQGQQQPMQQRSVQQQPVYHQQAHQQPAQQYQNAAQLQPAQQRPAQQYQQPVQPQPIQQLHQPVQQLQQPMQQRPVQQQYIQQLQQPVQQQSKQPQLGQQLQQPLQQRPAQQQPPQQPVQQQSTGQRIPAPSNNMPQTVNRQSISSAASIRSVGSVNSSHTNPSQTLGSPTSFPVSVSQHAAPNFITCSLCTTDITNDSTHLECLACTSAQVPTFFCTQCCVSKGAVTNHHHHMSNFVSVSDVVTFDPDVSVHGWDVRKSAIGINWYHHKGSKIKTFEKPKPPIPVAQPQVFRTDSSFPDGWEEIKDPDGRLFYYHRATKVSRWTRPQGSQLPAGWMECTNPDGRTYYLNTITQATTWDRPVGSSQLANDQRSISSATGTFPETTERSPIDNRQSISSQGQSTATPQSPTSVRSSTILETVEWSSAEIEKSTVPAHRAASVPNAFIQTTNWSPSDPVHRPIPTRADTQPQPGEWIYDQYGHRKNSRAFSKDSLASGSAAATKAVVKSTKTAANATAKGVKVAAKKLKNSKNAQRIVAGVGMAAVNAILIDQLGFSIPTGVGTAAVGLVNAIDFDQTTTVVDVTDTEVDVDNDVGDSADVGGNMEQANIPDNNADTVDVNQMNGMPGNDYAVGGTTEVIETTTVVQEEIIILPGGPVPMVQQPQQMGPGGTYVSPHQVNAGIPGNGGPGPIPGSVGWEFSNMQRPAAMAASHIPIHVPNQANQRMAPTAPVSGAQTQRPTFHPGTVQHQNPPGHGHGNFGNVAQSHIPIHNAQHALPHQNQPQQHAPNQTHNPGHSHASHQPQWANRPHIHPQQQGQNQHQSPQQPQNKPQAQQPPRPQQGQMPNQQQGPQGHKPNQPPFNQQQGPQGHKPNQQQGPQPQKPNQPPFNQQHNQSQPQRPQSQNPSRPQAVQNHNVNQQHAQALVDSKPSKPLLKPHQKAALMNAGMKIGSSLLRSAIRSSMNGNSAGNDYDYDDNDNSFDFNDNSNSTMDDLDVSNDADNGFGSNNNFDNSTADYDTQDQDQDQFVDVKQQLDNDFSGNGYDTGYTNDMNDYAGGDQYFSGGGDSANDADDANTYDSTTIDMQGTDPTGYDTTQSAQAGFNVAPDTTYASQTDINQQAQGIFQTSMADDNAAMNGIFTTPDTSCSDPPDLNPQGQGIFQASIEDDNAAMGNDFTTPDVVPSQDTLFGPNAGAEADTAAANNLWTMDVPGTGTSQTSGTFQPYQGLTSASLSGPMIDYYDSFAAFGGEIPLEEDPNQDEDPTTPVNASSGDGFSQDPTLVSADQDVPDSLNQENNTLTGPDTSLNPDLQSANQFQDSNTDLDSQDSNILSAIPSANPNPNPTTGSAAISHLYDGSAYDDPSSSVENSPVDVYAATPPIGMMDPKIVPLATVVPVPSLIPPAMPTMATPDVMPDPASLIVG